METAMTKPQARAAARQRRAALDMPALGAAMAGALFRLPLWQGCGTVFCFVSLRDEPDTLPILRRALADGKRLAVPRVLPGAAGAMEPVLLAGLDQLQPAAYGILEPAGGERLPAGAMGADALALIPCLAADRRGVRLGRGGGYYDRFLGQYKGRKLLLCPQALLFDRLPCDPWDVPFAPDEILTEKGILV